MLNGCIAYICLVSFLYPLFLLAGLSVAIPVLIHLFNLRRYKTVYFPHTRFLKNIQLRSQKQSQLKYKWLLALRILFILSLVLAFAQPFFLNKGRQHTKDRLQVVYIDNSGSMSVKNGTRISLDVAKDAARRQIQELGAARVLLLSNDKPASYHPVSKDQALAALSAIDISPVYRTMEQVLSQVQGIMESEAATDADLYCYSDFQSGSFPLSPAGLPMEHIYFHGVPVRAAQPANLFIDTAFLTTPVLQNGQSNTLIVKSKRIGRTGAPVLQLSVNGQVKTAATPQFNEQGVSTDTLSFLPGSVGWQQIQLTINDASVRFDDTFRIAAKSAAALSVLTLNEGDVNPFIQTAFHAYQGFRLDQETITGARSWKGYNLVVLNNISSFSDLLIRQATDALQQGQSILIFPARTPATDNLSTGLSKIAGIRITGLDTAAQTVAMLQQGSELVKNVFDRIPDNVQLPQVNWHYKYDASLLSNQQSVMSFRNGDPFLAQYTPSRGKLYLCAAAADLRSGNFVNSYFFVPFLYQMTVQSQSGSVFAATAGSNEPVYLAMDNADERNMVHLYGEGLDIIPPQRAAGAGSDILVGQAVQQPGFYVLAAGKDSVTIALNQDRKESDLTLPDMGMLKKQWQGDRIQWQDVKSGAAETFTESGSGFPLWKVCVILALLMLAAETYLLAAGYRKQTAVS